MKKQYRLVFYEEYIITCQHISSHKQVSGFTKAAEDPFNSKFTQRDRKKYHEACTFLAKMRLVYEKIGERGTWTRYIATLHQQNRHLPALKDELAKAKL